jgi:3-phosphoshikimate 1-carboxyvinyltransferase
MLACLRLLGVRVASSTDAAITTIDGCGGSLPAGPIDLPTRLAGTTSRFITAVAALGTGPYLIDGAAPLRARPMQPLHDALSALGATVVAGERAGHLPVTVSGPLKRVDHVEVRGDISRSTTSRFAATSAASS